ncbi:hypothetical protein SDC9_154677 [bioreactor metagenome]|uniref:Uncharacterized protein n=1 Tax=bioreactor metagenome TaxID=1076179 RepID=A0A645EZP3_9ZZZZ
MAHAVSDFCNRHRLHAAKPPDKMRKKGGPRRRAELLFDFSAVNRYPPKQQGRGWRGHRKDAMGASDKSRTDMHRRGADAFGRQHVKQKTTADNIGHRVERADLVEMNLIGRTAVHLPFGLPDEPVYGQGVGFDLLGQIEAFDQSAHLFIAEMPVAVRMDFLMAVMVVMPLFVTVIMFMIMIIEKDILLLPYKVDVLCLLLLPVHMHPDHRSPDAALFGRRAGPNFVFCLGACRNGRGPFKREARTLSC